MGWGAEGTLTKSLHFEPPGFMESSIPCIVDIPIHPQQDRII